MVDEPDQLVLVIRRRMDAKFDRALDELRDVKVRLTGVEENLAGVHRRIDRLDDRVAKIERRLTLEAA